MQEPSEQISGVMVYTHWLLVSAGADESTGEGVADTEEAADLVSGSALAYTPSRMRQVRKAEVLGWLVVEVGESHVLEKLSVPSCSLLSP